MLGPLQVVRNGEVVPIGGPNVRLTLALLLSQHSTVVSVDRIAEHPHIDVRANAHVIALEGDDTLEKVVIADVDGTTPVECAALLRAARSIPSSSI